MEQINIDLVISQMYDKNKPWKYALNNQATVQKRKYIFFDYFTLWAFHTMVLIFYRRTKVAEIKGLPGTCCEG